MRRGFNAKPYRPPAGGFAPFPNPNVYSHFRPKLNKLPRYTNSTNITIQPGLVGKPATKPLLVTPDSCEDQLNNGMPYGSWIGLYGDGLYLPKFLGGRLTNTFNLNGKANRGGDCRQRGFKNVQAGRQWHGFFPWTSAETANCPDTICSGGTPAPYRSYQPNPTQVKYLTLATAVTTFNYEDWSNDAHPSIITGGVSGAVNIDPLSGYITHNILTNETDTAKGLDSGSDLIYKYASGGAGYTRDLMAPYPQTNYTHGMTTVLDNVVSQDVHCPGVTLPILGGSIEDLVGSLSSNMPAITDPNNYNQHKTWVDSSGAFPQNYDVTITWSRTATVYSWNIVYNYLIGSDPSNPLTSSFKYSFAGTLTLSNANNSSDVRSDCQSLLGYWDMTDDKNYPWRSDGLWQIAPLVTRDESSDAKPYGFFPALVDDHRSPVADKNGNNPYTDAPNTSPTPVGWGPRPGWTDASTTNNDNSGVPPSSPDYGYAAAWIPTYAPMAWFDTGAYGFYYGDDPVANHSGALALDYKRYGKTGKILGMPLPRALTDGDSYWYDSGFTVDPTGVYENFFDYRAEVWRMCDSGSGIDLYQQGNGEWLQDKINATGALLPLSATQWTPNNIAFTKPPFGWIINYDKNIYVAGGTDFFASGQSLMMQKIAYIKEIWPSQDFARPAGADKFIFDETKVYCVVNISGSGGGSTWTLTALDGTTPPDGLDLSGTWGGKSVVGFYTGCSYSGGTLTLGTKVSDVPSDWASASGDTTTAFGKLRWPAVAALLGRNYVLQVADIGVARVLKTYSLTSLGLGTTADALDLYDVNMNQLASNATVTRIKRWKSQNYSLGNVIIDSNANLQVCTRAGTAGGSEPTWATHTGDTTLDGDPSGGVIWTLVLTGSFAVDQTFTVANSYSSISKTAWITIHGAANWYWDDNSIKGDYVYYDWTFDYRTNGEIARLAGVTDCAGHTPPSGGPTANYNFSAFTQSQNAIQFNPCSPMVLCSSPNGEIFDNGMTFGTIYTIRNNDTGALRTSVAAPTLASNETLVQQPAWPATFNFDASYGARWQSEFEEIMIELYWQGPHRPCGLDSSIAWTEDGTDGNGICEANSGTVYYFQHRPYVEARSVLPSNGGPNQNETAPALPSGITVGSLSPVTHSDGLQPPNDQFIIGVDINTGNPSAAWTTWGYRQQIEQGACAPASCRFNYVDTENLPCVADKSLPPPSPPNTSLGGLGGLT